MKVPRKLVLIEWEDAYGVSSDWFHLDKVDREPVTAYSVGWVLHDDDRAITVVPHIVESGQGDQGCGDMVIPKGAIRNMREIQ